jgi:hypothetical protein
MNGQNKSGQKAVILTQDLSWLLPMPKIIDWLATR